MRVPCFAWPHVAERSGTTSTERSGLCRRTRVQVVSHRPATRLCRDKGISTPSVQRRVMSPPSRPGHQFAFLMPLQPTTYWRTCHWKNWQSVLHVSYLRCCTSYFRQRISSALKLILLLLLVEADVLLPEQHLCSGPACHQHSRGASVLQPLHTAKHV